MGFFGPFLVLALVLVLCPRVGNFLLCLIPLLVPKSSVDSSANMESVPADSSDASTTVSYTHLTLPTNSRV